MHLALLKKCQKNIRGSHKYEELVYMDRKVVASFALRNARLKRFYEIRPGLIGMKFLAKNCWWLHISRQTYHHGINCTQNTKSGTKI